MAFESLTDKLNQVFRNLSGKGKLTEGDVKTAMKEVKMALLEADVNFKVVKKFVATVQERAVGADVMNGLNPAQMVIKIVNEEMTELMGSETTQISLEPGGSATVIMMAGLQGAGKTTTAAKLAGKFNYARRVCFNEYLHDCFFFVFHWKNSINMTNNFPNIFIFSDFVQIIQ